MACLEKLYAFHPSVGLSEPKSTAWWPSGRRVCKRCRTPSVSEESILPTLGGKRYVNLQIRSEADGKFSQDPKRIKKEHAAIRDEHFQSPNESPLSPLPSESSGFEGWREQDDDYFKELRRRELAFRAPTSSTPADFELAERPLDRSGNPITYPAAAKYCHESGRWVPTTAEEEEALRNPHPVKDPYYVREALEDETHTTLNTDRMSDTESDNEEENSVYMEGGFEFSSPLVRDMSPHRRKRLNMEPGGWRVVHLGTSSAIPTLRRNVSSTALITKSFDTTCSEPSMFLVDAGENTDRRLVQCDWCMTHGFRWIRAIFITHLHGDHLYGLPTLLASIGKYAQHRRRHALESGDEDSEPVIRVFGPYGTRGFVRASLYWTNPVGVHFSVSELVPRAKDFAHFSSSFEDGEGQDFIVDRETEDISPVSGIDVRKDSPPPHPEEMRADDIHASEDGVWHVWEESDNDVKFEVVAAPLKHRMPCFGYVFRESVLQGPLDASGTNKKEIGGEVDDNGKDRTSSSATTNMEIDTAKAKALGVHGTQYRVLRSGRAITVSKTGLVVRPEDVAIINRESNGPDSFPTSLHQREKESISFRRKVTILGDTCDSSAISEAAMNSDLLIHEATFTEELKEKARVAMHSTARMAGEFARSIQARKLALTHFSSRYEYFQHLFEEEEEGKPGGKNGEFDEGSNEFNSEELFSSDMEMEENDDLTSPNHLVREALLGYGDENANIVAALDFMEHDIVAASDVSCASVTPENANVIPSRPDR